MGGHIFAIKKKPYTTHYIKTYINIIYILGGAFFYDILFLIKNNRLTYVLSGYFSLK